MIRHQLKRIATVERALPPSIGDLLAFLSEHRGESNLIPKVCNRFGVTTADLHDLVDQGKTELLRRRAAMSLNEGAR